MIRFALKCSQGHSFDSWFKSNDAYDSLKAAGMVACAVCGDASVEKDLMAPTLSKGAKVPARPASDPVPDAVPSLSAPASPAEQALTELRKKVEENSDYVGSKFTEEARRIHNGDTAERSIYGEATAKDAKELIEDGIPVVPLPFMPGRKTN